MTEVMFVDISNAVSGFFGNSRNRRVNLDLHLPIRKAVFAGSSLNVFFKSRLKIFIFGPSLLH